MKSNCNKHNITLNLKLASLILLLALFSCTKEKTADLKGLLSTVPSSAAGVVGINLESLIEDAGCKLRNNQIITGEVVNQLMEKVSPGDRKNIDLLVNGETGINLECAVIFIDSNRTFVTFSLYDVAKFTNFIESQTSNQFEEAGSGVKVCGNVAVKGAQGWVCLSSDKRIDADAIAGYAGLNESRSYLTKDMAKSILESKTEITGWCVLNVMLRNALSRSEMSIMTIASGLLFEDAESLWFTIDFKNGELEFLCKMLNDKGKPSKYLLPVEKINQKAIQDLGGNYDALIAFVITPKLIDKISKLGTTFGGSLLEDFKDNLKNIDGTVAVGVKFTENGEPILNGVVSTKGKISDPLRNLLAEIRLSPKVEENYLRFSNGSIQGTTPAVELGEMLKGSWIGIAADVNAEGNLLFHGYKVPSDLKNVSLRLMPNNGSLELLFSLTSTDTKQNILLTLLQSGL